MLSFTSFLTQLRWLYAPTSSAIIFTLRTSFSALISLYIAFAMQLDSPYWAPITVWMVCVAAPEENDSKAYWLVFGTILGGIVGMLIIAAFPQQPALFIILVGLWVSGCCFASCFMSNFRVHGMRIAAITGALVSLGSASEPNNCFDIAIARSSYVLLGVISQKISYSLFIGDRRHVRVQWLQNHLKDTVNTTCLIFSNFFAGNNENLNKNKSIFLNIYQLNQQSEFVDLAAQSRSHLGAHGRLILSIINSILIKTFCLENLLKNDPLSKDLGDLPNKLSTFFLDLPNLLSSHHDSSTLANVFQKLKDQLQNELKEYMDTIHLDDNNSAIYKTKFYFTHCSIIYDILTEIDILFKQFNIYTSLSQPIAHKIYSYKNIYKAIFTALRIFIPIVIGGIVWEITSWQLGAQFILFICILSCILYLTDFPRQVAIGFFKGTCFAIFITGLINFLFIQYAYNIEGLTYIIMPCMIVSGLAVSSGVMPINTIAYNIFFFVLIQFNNQNIINETTFFNMSFCIFLAAAFMVLTAFIIFPFSDEKECFYTCKQMIKNIHKLTKSYLHYPTVQQWVDSESCNLVYLLKHTNKLVKTEQETYFLGASSAIFVGIHIINIRIFIENTKDLPSELKENFKNLLIELKSNNIDIDNIDMIYNQITHYICENKDHTTIQWTEIFSSLCIIKSQLSNYIKFTQFVR